MSLPDELSHGRIDRPIPPDGLARAMKEGGRRRRRRAQGLLATALAAGAAAVVLPLQLLPGHTNTASAVPATVDGKTVYTGLGTLWSDRINGPHLCTDFLHPYGGFEGCAGVVVREIDVSRLPGLQRRGDAWHSSRVRVYGTYRDGTLSLIRPPEATKETLFHLQEGPVPCPAPANGWSKESVSAADSHALQVYAAAHRDIFGGITGSKNVTVFAVTNGVSKVRRDLEAVYHHNLCVAQVPNTEQTLNNMENKITVSAPHSIHYSAIGYETLIPYVCVEVFVADAPTTRWFFSLTPKGLVKLFPVLTPVG